MKMSELILAIGDENVILQNLLNDAQSIDKTKHGTKLTFYTDAIQAEELLNGGKTKNMGLVLWLPRDRVDAAIAAAKASTVSDDRTAVEASDKGSVNQSIRTEREAGG